MTIQQWFKKHWRALIPIIVLNIIALRQLHLVNTDHLTRWKGGGFGMFSEISRRFHHIHLMDRGTFKCVDAPLINRRQLRKIDRHPNLNQMEHYLNNIRQYKWRFDRRMVNGKVQRFIRMAGKNEPIQGPDLVPNISSIELHIYDIRFDQVSGSISPKLIRKLTTDLTPFTL